MFWIGLAVLIGLLLLGLVVYDLIQRKHAILRNFPIIGHLRYFLEAVGLELRQYIVTDNDLETLFPECGLVPRTSEQERVIVGKLMTGIDLDED